MNTAKGFPIAIGTNSYTLQIMIKNYFKIAWRNLLKNKMYSFVNIFGLAVGMAVTIMIGLWMNDESQDCSGLAKPDFQREHRNRSRHSSPTRAHTSQWLRK
jgi:hypothetical protein